MATRSLGRLVASPALRFAMAVLVSTAAQGCTEPTAPPARGTLRVDIFGLPSGSTATVSLASPSGEVHEVVGAATIPELPVGTYAVTVGAPTDSSDRFAVSAPATIRVRNGRTDSLRVIFSYTTGGLELALEGLLDSDSATVKLAVPGGAPIVLGVPSRTRGLTPGRYLLLLDTLVRRGERFIPTDSQYVEIAQGAATARKSVHYRPTTGSLDLRVSGLPPGARPRAFVYQAVYGGDRFEATVSMDTVLRGLPGGWYYIEPLRATAGSFGWAGERDPDVGEPAVYITPNVVPIERRFKYVVGSGAVRLDVLGLPPGAQARVRVRNGDVSVPRTLRGDTLQDAPIGRWIIEPALVSVNGTLYGAGIPDTVDVAVGQFAEGAITFAPQVDPVDVRINKVVLTQAIQTDSNSVPFVSGVDAMLYVDVRADRANALTNIVRVRMHESGATTFDTTLTGQIGIAEVGGDDWQRYGGFRVRIPGSVMRPGAALSVVSDPDDLIPDGDPTNDRFPASGVPLPLDVRTPPAMRLRFVPVRFPPPAYGYPSPDAAGWVQRMKVMLPVGPVEWDIRAPYTVQTPEPGPDDVNRWVAVLSEIDALRVLEGADRHYAGVLSVNYDAGIAGIGLLPGRSIAIWDRDTPGIDLLAHELGHNFARRHAPGCGAAGVDPEFPRADGSAGDWGYNFWRRTFITPEDKDVMTYCAPHWISAYTAEGIISFRDSVGGAVALTDVLLVSGRLVNGVVQLDPAFTVPGFATPATGGEHRLELRDAADRVILSRGFSASELTDAADGTALFTVAIPLRDLGGRTAARIRVESGTSVAEIEQGVTRADPTRLAVTRRPDGVLEVDGRAASARGLIVRDAATGRILSISRTGVARLAGRFDELDVIATDGVSSVRRRLRADVR